MAQEQFADAIERDQKAISEYENGKLPAIDLPRFAAILGVPILYFFEGEYELNELDGLLLQQFHALPTAQDKHTAIQAVRLISDTVKRYVPQK